MPRAGDLEQLERIASQFPNREQFLTELTLDPPRVTGDLAGAPHLDEDYLILSTIHSAKGQEWDRVAILHVIDYGGSAKAGKQLAIDAIEVIDRFLLAAVAFIVALGLCKLFVNSRVPVPHWLEIATLDDLKDKLLRVIVVILAVVFLGQIAAWDGGYEIAALAGGIAVVVGSLSYFLFAARKEDES
jgi:uncharacterized membrane protein YqhA